MITDYTVLSDLWFSKCNANVRTGDSLTCGEQRSSCESVISKHKFTSVAVNSDVDCFYLFCVIKDFLYL